MQAHDEWLLDSATSHECAEPPRLLYLPDVEHGVGQHGVAVGREDPPPKRDEALVGAGRADDSLVAERSPREVKWAFLVHVDQAGRLRPHGKHREHGQDGGNETCYRCIGRSPIVECHWTLGYCAVHSSEAVDSRDC